MSDKKIDMSVFVGQDFDCEFSYSSVKRWTSISRLKRIHYGAESSTGNDIFKCMHGGLALYCRPRLNHWHFNNGSMVLPDGLVVETMEYHCDAPDKAAILDGKVCSLSLKSNHGWSDCDISDLSDFCAVKIIGAHPDCAIDAKRFGIPVVEVS